MKASETTFAYPLLGFTPDRDIWGFPDFEALTTCGPRTLKDASQVGMELIDCDGRRWIVRSVQRLGRDRGLIPWLFWSLLTTPGWRVELELDERPSVGLPEIKDRVCASVEANSTDYCPEDDPEELAARLGQIRAAPTAAAIHDLIGLDSFMAY